MQVLSHLLSFPATHPALPAALQQKALLTMLSAFSSSSAFSALPVSTSPEQALSTFPSEPEPEEHTHIEQAVVPALEAMAALGHEGPLESTAVPVALCYSSAGWVEGWHIHPHAKPIIQSERKMTEAVPQTISRQSGPLRGKRSGEEMWHCMRWHG